MPSSLPRIFAPLLALVLFASTLSAQQNAGNLIPTSQRQPAPDFTLTGVDGRPLSIAQYKGQVVLLDFWAIACGGCKLELPWYVEFQSKYQRQGLSLIGLDMYGETPDAVRTFATKQHLTYPLAIGTDQIGGSYHLGEMPLTVLIDRHGRIAEAHAGVVNKAAFESDIQRLLAEPK